MGSDGPETKRRTDQNIGRPHRVCVTREIIGRSILVLTRRHRPMEMAQYAESLAHTYLERGRCSGDWKDYLKAHGLANYCVAVDSTPERCRLVYDVEVSWYKGNHPISYEDHQQLTNQHKQLLEEFREEINANFKPLDALGLLLDEENIYSDQNMANARKFSDKLFDLSKKCSEDFVSVTRSIIESSVELLKLIKMNPPCGFAVIGLGSVAKGEATPYSDVEYAFIIEHEDQNYFEMLAMDSYFRIGNMRETPLKCFNIKELKVEKGSPPVIADLQTVGFRIDGISKSAGNIPTGNGLEEGQSLTFTVEKLMDLYRGEAEAPFAGMAGDKSDMLSSTVVIYSNEGDESSLHNRFIEERISYEQHVAQNSAAVKEKRMKSFLTDVRKFTFPPNFVKYQPPQNMNIKVKDDIFRYPTLLANNIKMFMAWNLRYPWQIFSELHLSKKISDETYSYMNIVLALSIYMRTRAYLHQRSQTEYVSLILQQKGSVKQFYQIPSSLFVVLGCLLVPIKRYVKAYIETAASAAPDDTALAITIQSMVTNIKFCKSNHLLKAEISYFSGDYNLAMKELRRCFKKPVEAKEPSECFEVVLNAVEIFDQAPKYMELTCYILYHTKSYRAAADYFSWLIDNGHGNVGLWKLLSACCRKEIGDYKVARQLLNEAKQLLEQTYGSERKSSTHSLYTADTNHRDISTTYTDIGGLYDTMGEYEEALKYYKLALEMDIAMFGETAHPDTATDYQGIGSTLLQLGMSSSALEYQLRSLEMRKSIYGAEANHPAIAASYNNIANVYDKNGDYTVSLEYHIKSLEMKNAIYGANANHLDIATSYYNIARLHNSRGEYSLALEYHTKALRMMEAIYGIGANHPDIADSYNTIAIIHYNRGEHSLSLKNHIESLEMKRAIFGAETNHPDIAGSYNNIASIYDSCGAYSLALEYHIKSLEMKKFIYVADTNHPDIASSYNNIASVYQKRSEYRLALEYLIKSLEMKKAIYGTSANHPSIAGCYNNIAGLYVSLGEQALALEYFIKSMEMRKAIHGTDSNHPDIATSYGNMASVYNNLGEHALSLEYHMKSLEMKKAIHGSNANHPGIALNYHNIANLLDNCGQLPLSLEYYSKSLEMMKALYGADSDHPHLMLCKHNMAATLQRVIGSTRRQQTDTRSSPCCIQ